MVYISFLDTDSHNKPCPVDTFFKEGDMTPFSLTFAVFLGLVSAQKPISIVKERATNKSVK